VRARAAGARQRALRGPTLVAPPHEAVPPARSYKYTDVVPTHVHPNFDKLHMADIGDNYVPYNKPGSIKHWCAPSRASRTA
jgi:hypothetical protein